MQHCSSHHHCLSTAIAHAEAQCQAQKTRFTTQRRDVLRMVWSSHQPVKAYDILAHLQQHDASAKPPTVYRALDFLMEHGFIHKLHRLNAYIGCAHTEREAHCCFLICAQCHDVSEIDDAVLYERIGESARTQHFTPHHISVEIEGLCRDCRSGTGENA